MEINGETLIGASVEDVWNGLNSPEILRKSIPGCEALEQKSPTEFTATVVQKIGPVSATFSGEVTLTDLNPPNSYRIVGKGSGGVAGFAKGSAFVELSEQEKGTILTYTVNANLGGKIAQLGSRMIKGIAKSLAKEFFRRFSEHVSSDADKSDEAPQTIGKNFGSKKPVNPDVTRPNLSEGPGWRLFALSGWVTAAGFCLIAALLALN